MVNPARISGPCSMEVVQTSFHLSSPLTNPRGARQVRLSPQNTTNQKVSVSSCQYTVLPIRHSDLYPVLRRSAENVSPSNQTFPLSSHMDATPITPSYSSHRGHTTDIPLQGPAVHYTKCDGRLAVRSQHSHVGQHGNHLYRQFNGHRVIDAFQLVVCDFRLLGVFLIELLQVVQI